MSCFNRKINIFIIFFIFISLVFYIVFSFTYYPIKMEKFCDAIRVGENIEDIKSNAKNENFDIIDDTEDSGFLIHDTKTMGTSTCMVNYNENSVVISKKYTNM